ncbi:MAG: hypothetical protein C0436_04960 [Alphaproteobacteria bacterium]|nr:hypothetical protein [Alphaproteobacteria bacterium]
MYREDFDVRTLSSEQCRQVALETWKNPEKFAKFFFPTLVPSVRVKDGKEVYNRMPWLHKGILAITTKQLEWLENDPDLGKILSNFVFERDGETIPIFTVVAGKLQMKFEKYTMFMVPRGFAKTTIVGVITPLYLTVYQELKVGLYVSATATHANTQLATQKRQIEGNARLMHFFGQLKPAMQDSAKWREDEFETISGVVWVARGRGGQVRGLNINGQRPQLVLVDDLEDKASVAIEEQRLKLKDWFYADLMPCLPSMDESAGIAVLGTLLHPEALLMTLAVDPQWNVVKFGSHDKQGELLWPENMDESKLEKERVSATLAGTLAAFYMERMSELRVGTEADFQQKNIQYGGPAGDEELFQTLYVDPAISEKRTADHCTFTVAAASNRAKIYVRHSSGAVGMSPRDQVNKIFELYTQYKPNRVGIESNAYQKALVHLVREEMFRRKLYFEIVPVVSRIEKFARIKGILQPRYANRFVWHEGRFIMLEQQLLMFPHNRKDDYADGCAGAMSLLDDAAFMAESGDVAGAEAPDLETVIGGSWRSAV